MLDGLEADIAVPDLKLAIEWNGPIHFKPIHGEEKLLAVQDVDKRKMEVANRKDIRLMVISDQVSTEKFVEEQFTEIIRPLIERMLEIRVVAEVG